MSFVNDRFQKMIEQEEKFGRLIDPLGAGVSRPFRLLDTQATSLLRDDAVRRAASIDLATKYSGLLENSGLARAAMEANHLKLLAGPLADYHRGALGVSDSMRSALEAAARYQDHFKMPVVGAVGRLAEAANARLFETHRLTGFESRLREFESAMKAMNSPWLHNSHALQSATAFAEIHAMGRAINISPFEERLSDTLRRSLGDWRGVTEFAPPIIENPVARSDFYVGLGFNPELTDFTAEAFDETIYLAGLDDIDASEVGDEEVDLLRNDKAYRRLLRLERALRAFIDVAMTEAFGPNWIKQQTPAGMKDEWEEKRATALAKGESEQPLISYADFSDYIKIIERSDNWKQAFSAVFGRRDDIRESLVRLAPVRICTMHSRLISLDDEFLLLVEARRILCAINRITS